jgi:dimethylaniline monooxygenase (N-oxide forming)
MDSIPPIKTVGIIGAGLSGLVTAKTCLEYGFRVKVFEKDSELGGVWSPSRRYPGLSTQNTKDTYYFTDFPMPAHFAEWPSGEEMHSYLTSYAKKFGVFSIIQFSHEISQINYLENCWTLLGKHHAIPFSEQVDFLIVCNGTFSDPHIPSIPGMEDFLFAGGKIVHSTQFNSVELCRGKRTVVVGYSKSGGDVAVAASETSQSMHMIFREPKWKVPRFVNGVNSKYLLLNRLGEALIKPGLHNKMEKIVHTLGMPQRMLSFMERYVTKKQKLVETGLLPKMALRDLVFGEISVETNGFFEKVHQGAILTKQGEIASIRGKQLTLTNGETLECDLIIFATGFKQTLPFMPDRYMALLTDDKGYYILYRHILPAEIPALAFVGYNSSLYCSLTSEFAALWVCEYLKGRILRPTNDQIIKEGKEFLKWISNFRMKGASKGLSVGPCAMHTVDRLLKDMGAKLSLLSLIPDWLVTISPGRYQKVKQKIMRRNGRIKAALPEKKVVSEAN